MSEEIKDLLKEIVEHRKDEKGTVLERHAQTLILGLVTIGIVFVASSITSQNADIRVLQAQNANLVEQVKDLKELVLLSKNNFVSRGEYQLYIRSAERRISVLEEKMHRHERDQPGQ